MKHLYVSTYCVHGLHGDCRRTCKTCDAPCLCPCHPRHPDAPPVRDVSQERPGFKDRL